MLNAWLHVRVINFRIIIIIIIIIIMVVLEAQGLDDYSWTWTDDGVRFDLCIISAVISVLLRWTLNVL